MCDHLLGLSGEAVEGGEGGSLSTALQGVREGSSPLAMDGEVTSRQGEGRKGSEDWGNGWGEEGGWSGEASPQKEPEK